MPPPAELSFEEILKFMLEHNGKVTNHELVKHFKVFLMNADSRDEARNTFKKHVNTLAIIKNQNNEKWLLLKKKYVPKDNDEVGSPKVPESPNAPALEMAASPEANIAPPPYRPPPPIQLNQDFSILPNLLPEQVSKFPAQMSQSVSKESLFSNSVEETPPKIHPRRRSSEKSSSDKQSSIPELQLEHTPFQSTQDLMEENVPPPLTTSRSDSMLVENEQTISVKERKKMFNRMASESDVLKSNRANTSNPLGMDEEDRAALDHKGETDPLDSKQKQWILCAARGEYHALAKMCKENPKLVRTKDPFTTAMHWACKRGDENLVKMLAGVARQVVNERSGYTPLHIAMQFRHEHVYKLLVEVYDADPNVRDWSGRKPRQYLVQIDTSLSPGSYRKSGSLGLRRTVTTPPTINPHSLYLMKKKESFLRIGSLNVRVKKTTEVFSNFLGVGTTRSSAYIPKSRDKDMDRRSDDSDQLHKSWGSADNIQKDDKLMPPPMSGKVKRRGASGRKGLAAHSRSTPSTPDQPRAHIGPNEQGDSDSDSAAGFHSAWRQQRASCT